MPKPPVTQTGIEDPDYIEAIVWPELRHRRVISDEGVGDERNCVMLPAHKHICAIKSNNRLRQIALLNVSSRVYSVEKLAEHALRHLRGGTSILGNLAIVDPGSI